MEQLYEYLNISRQAVQQSRHRRADRKAYGDELIKEVLKIRKNHSRMGSRCLYSRLKAPQIGITAFEKLLSERGLTVPVKKKRIITTKTNKFRSFPNLTNGLHLNDISQLVVGDITYYQSYGTTYYIFEMKDYYSGRIVGLAGDDNMRSDKAMQCLFQLKRLRGPNALKNLILHSDGGGQYRSDEFLKWTEHHHIRISQAENCMQNGCAEQCNHVIKNDYLINETIRSVAQLKRALKRIKRLINYERPVKKLKYMTPVEFEKSLPGIKKEDRKEFICYDFTQE